MPRPRNATLSAAWKLYMPAPLTARVELLLRDPMTNKPKHGERARLTAVLWEDYLRRISGYGVGDKTVIPLPELDDAVYLFAGVEFTLEQLRNRLT